MLTKIIIIILLLLIFYYIITINIEKFISSNYTNTNEYPWERYNINSKLPYDITLKNNTNLFYDIGNDELDEKLKTAFNINSEKIILYIEGVEWSKWIPAKLAKNKRNLNNYFTNFINYFKKIIRLPLFDLPNDINNRYKIKNNVLLKYKYNKKNTKELLMEIDIVISRQNKPLSKHIKFLTITDGNYNKIVMANVVGVVDQFELSKTYGSINDSKNYQYFEPEFNYKYDMNDYILDTNDKLVSSQVEYNLYNKLLKEL
jgi:hypothetical protein